MTPRPQPARTRDGWPTARSLKLGRLAKVYEQAFPRKEGQLAAGEWLIERLRLGARVLDVGCGIGVPTARQLADAGCDVTGIDISEEALEVARDEVPGVRFLRHDILDMPNVHPARGGFDAIVAFFSLLTLPPAEIPGVLRRLHDMLKPGAYFLLSGIDTDLHGVPIQILDCPLRGTGYPGAELRALVGEAGFEVLDLRHLSYAAPTPKTPPEVQIFVYCRRPGGRGRQ
jgi:SAM-dependent methyltransferase